MKRAWTAELHSAWLEKAQVLLSLSIHCLRSLSFFSFSWRLSNDPPPLQQSLYVCWAYSLLFFSLVSLLIPSSTKLVITFFLCCYCCCSGELFVAVRYPEGSFPDGTFCPQPRARHCSREAPPRLNLRRRTSTMPQGFFCCF